MTSLTDVFTKILDSAGIASALLLIAIAMWMYLFRRMEVDSGRRGLKK